MSDQAKSERAKRLERWAETAMAMLLRRHKDADPAIVAKKAWVFATHMEDQRTYVLDTLVNLEPQSPTEKTPNE